MPSTRKSPVTRTSPTAALDLRGPVRTAGLCLALFAVAGVAALALPAGDRSDVIDGTLVAETRTVAVVHAAGGVIGQLHVHKGAKITPGQVIASLDTKALDAEIAALRVRAEKAGLQLDRVRAETLAAGRRSGAAGAADTMAVLADRLRRIETETAGINARIAEVERQIADAVIRTAAGGRVAWVMAGGEGSIITPGATVARIEARNAGLAIDARVRLAHIAMLSPGATLRLWLRNPSDGPLLPLSANVRRTVQATPSPDASGTHVALRVSIDLSEPLAGTGGEFAAGKPVRFVLAASERPLIDQMTARLALIFTQPASAARLQEAP